MSGLVVNVIVGLIMLVVGLKLIPPLILALREVGEEAAAEITNATMPMADIAAIVLRLLLPDGMTIISIACIFYKLYRKLLDI